MMKKRVALLPLVLSVFLCLFLSPAHGEDSETKPRTFVPEGVTEIDLRTVLGDDALEVVDAWTQNGEIFTFLLSRPMEEEGLYTPTLFELIVWDRSNGTILSRTPIPPAGDNYRQGWEDSTLYLLFEPNLVRWYDPAYRFTKATVALDGKVEIDNNVSNRLTVMPGGKTIIREADDGSLYAYDVAAQKEELLIQGVPGMGIFWDWDYSEEEIAELFPFFNDDHEAIAEYVPFWDELPENWTDLPDDFSYPFKPHEGSLSIRQFYVYKPLDEHRFVYTVSSWEWDNGYGIYDLRTHTDHRITGRGFFYGMGGNTLFGSTLMADADTYDSSLLPESVREQFESVSESWYGDGNVDYDISPSATLLARSDMQSWESGICMVTITDIQTGNIVKAYDIVNPLATEYSVAFYDDVHCMLFCAPKERGSAYIYLLDPDK